MGPKRPKRVQKALNATELQPAKLDAHESHSPRLRWDTSSTQSLEQFTWTFNEDLWLKVAALPAGSWGNCYHLSNITKPRMCLGTVQFNALY